MRCSYSILTPRHLRRSLKIIYSFHHLNTFLLQQGALGISPVVMIYRHPSCLLYAPFSRYLPYSVERFELSDLLGISQALPNELTVELFAVGIFLFKTHTPKWAGMGFEPTNDRLLVCCLTIKRSCTGCCLCLCCDLIIALHTGDKKMQIISML